MGFKEWRFNRAKKRSVRHTIALGFNYDDIDYKRVFACWDREGHGIRFNIEVDFWRLHIADRDYFFLFSVLNHENLHRIFEYSQIIDKSIDVKPDGSHYHGRKDDYDEFGFPTPLLRQLDQTKLDDYDPELRVVNYNATKEPSTQSTEPTNVSIIRWRKRLSRLQDGRRIVSRLSGS